MTPIDLLYARPENFNDFGNFGDELSPYIVSKLSGRSVNIAFPTEIKKNKLVAIGSILAEASDGDIIWGAGLISEKHCCNKKAKFIAVRGPKTWALIHNKDDIQIIFGDPALIMPFLYMPDVNKEYEKGIVPHYVDFKRINEIFGNDSTINVINVMRSVEEVVNEINKCNFIYSSSLHGVIVSEAYNIPTRWVIISDNVMGEGFKFYDYYESTMRMDVSFLDWREDIKLEDNLPQKSSHLEEMAMNLYNCFPYLKDIK